MVTHSPRKPGEIYVMVESYGVDIQSVEVGRLLPM